VLTDRPLRVLVVDDTVTYRRIVSDVLATIPGVEVVGSAHNGRIALERLPQLKPDLLTLDLEMPEVDGLEVLRRLPPDASVGAIMLSAHTTAGATATLQALQLGAFDFVLKPAGADAQANAEALARELRLQLEAFARRRNARRQLQQTIAAARSAPPASPPPKTRPLTPGMLPEVVVIGISTGGPPALTTLISALPADLRAPVAIVQHMPAKFTKSLAEDLDRRSPLSVREATDGEALRSGAVVFAPGARQMKLERGADHLIVRINEDPPEKNCRPSADYLFRSAAHVCGARTVAVVMTGMGDDGALGCRLLSRAGAAIVTQSAESCVVYGMPKLPTEEGLANVVAPLEQIAEEIIRIVGRRSPACV
jgi:two-component system chemotaxis response regulator CheB